MNLRFIVDSWACGIAVFRFNLTLKFDILNARLRMSAAVVGQA